MLAARARTSTRRRSTRTRDLLPLIDGLTLLALVGIVDPPRPQAKAAIAEAHGAGIQVRMITGDHAVTAEAIARKLGIRGRAITGAELAAMSDDEALEAIDGIGVIARVTPEDKVRLVDILKRKGHIVAMTGDGVNDAPALKRADIGIAMGITGTEVSKEAAAMILTDDDFSTIVKAVSIGRGLYDNLKKYIQFQMAALIGFIITFLGASIFDVASGVPFVPLQTLWVNFTTQVFQAIGLGYGEPASGPDAAQAAPRERADPAARCSSGWWSRGLVLGGTTLGIIWWADDEHGDAVARTMGMTTLRDRERLPLLHRQGRAALGLQRGDLRRQAAPARDRPVGGRDPVRHRARDLPAHPRHGQPDRPAVGRLHPRRRDDPRRLRGTQVLAAPQRRCHSCTSARIRSCPGAHVDLREEPHPWLPRPQ